MKRFYALVAFVLMAVTTILAAGIHATETDNLKTKADTVALFAKCFSVQTDSLYTQSEFTTGYDIQEYHGDSLRAGILNSLLIIKSKVIEDGITLPKVSEYNAGISLRTIYGEELLNSEDSIKEELDEIFEYDSTDFDETEACGSKCLTVDRGGVHISETIFDLIGYHRKDTVTIYDSPSIRVMGDRNVKVGDDIKLTANFNTGYPYNLDEFTGDENMVVKLYRAKDKDNVVLIDSIVKPFRVKGTERPLLAVIDQVVMDVKNPELGAYLLTCESDWKAIEPHFVIVNVIDTLRAEIKLDKEEYQLASTKTAAVSVKMDYRYPFVQTVEPDTVPTIRLCSLISKKLDEDRRDTLLTDTFKIADPKFAEDALNYEGSYNLDLSKIDPSRLSEGGDSVIVHFTVIFNGALQYATEIPARLIKDPNGTVSISIVGADRETNTWYSIDGRIVATPTRNGIYIRNGKKVVIKE